MREREYVEGPEAFAEWDEHPRRSVPARAS
jgi:hypothetical protein